MKKKMFNNNYNLTEAVLEGRKTMWRSVFDYETYRKLWDDMCRLGTPCFDTFDDFIIKRKAQYKVGEVVAVAQSYKDAGIDPHFLMFQPIKGSTYFAEMETEAMFTGGWNNKMFVRADLMPHRIRIIDIKVERLQDISDEDVLKEGIEKGMYLEPSNVIYYYDKFIKDKKTGKEKIEGYALYPAKDAFASLIDNMYGRGTWNLNPYVFAYTFELVK